MRVFLAQEDVNPFGGGGWARVLRAWRRSRGKNRRRVRLSPLSSGTTDDVTCMLPPVLSCRLFTADSPPVTFLRLKIDELARARAEGESWRMALTGKRENRYRNRVPSAQGRTIRRKGVWSWAVLGMREQSKDAMEAGDE